MKMLIASSLFLLSTNALLEAQERASYGPLGIVASSENDLSTARQLAAALSDALGKEKVTVSGQVRELREMSNTTLLNIAETLRVNWLAVVSFDRKDAEHGVFEVEVVHVVAKRIALRVTALFGVLRNVSTEIASQVTRAKNAVIQFMSEFKEVRVILNLLTHPGDVDYIFGNSAVLHTDKDGMGFLDTTQRVGKTTLRLMKRGYNPVTLDIVIPPVADTSYVLISKTVQLR